MCLLSWVAETLACLRGGWTGWSTSEILCFCSALFWFSPQMCFVSAQKHLLRLVFHFLLANSVNSLPSIQQVFITELLGRNILVLWNLTFIPSSTLGLIHRAQAGRLSFGASGLWPKADTQRTTGFRVGRSYGDRFPSGVSSFYRGTEWLQPCALPTVYSGLGLNSALLIPDPGSGLSTASSCPFRLWANKRTVTLKQTSECLLCEGSICITPVYGVTSQAPQFYKML